MDSWYTDQFVPGRGLPTGPDGGSQVAGDDEDQHSSERNPRVSDSYALQVLRETPGHLIRCSQQVHLSLWQARGPDTLTPVQYAVLLAAAQRRAADQRTLGEVASLDKSSVRDVVNRLARRRLLSIGRDPTDARRRPVSVTDAGRRELIGAAPAVLDVQERLLRRLSFADGERWLGVVRRVAYRGSAPDPHDATDDNLVPEGWPLRLTPVRLHTAPGHLIRRAQQVHTALWTALVGPDLTSVQYTALLLLEEDPAIDQSKLGERGSFDKSTIAELVARMEARGLIRRSRDADDARRNLLSATPHGREELRRRRAAVQEVQVALLAPLDEESTVAFVRLMQRVTAKEPAPHSVRERHRTP